MYDDRGNNENELSPSTKGKTKAKRGRGICIKPSNPRAVINTQGTFLIRVLLFSPTGSQAVGRGCLADVRTEAMLHGRRMRGHRVPQGQSEPVPPANAGVAHYGPGRVPGGRL